MVCFRTHASTSGFWFKGDDASFLDIILCWGSRILHISCTSKRLDTQKEAELTYNRIHGIRGSISEEHQPQTQEDALHWPASHFSLTVQTIIIYSVYVLYH